MLAEIDRREREAEGPKPLTAEARAHLGVAGSLYGVTTNRLFEITLGERGVTTREVAPLLVAVPVLGPERALQEDEYFSVNVDSLGFDRNGLLWATGDQQLYYCSVATGICATQGILPPDAWSIWFADNPQGEEVLLASDVGFTTSLLQRLAVPSIFGPLASQLLGRVELCAEPGPATPPGLVAVAGPVQKRDGVAVAVVRDEAALKLTFLQLGLAPGVVEQHRLPAELRPVAIVPTDRGVLLFGAQGAIHEWSSDGGLRRLTEAGYEWRAAAGFELELA
jgi:hypothetical protein